MTAEPGGALKRGGLRIPAPVREWARWFGPNEESGRLGDYSTTPRTVYITALAIPVGIAAAAGAWVLLRMIAIITNGLFFETWATELPSIEGHSVGLWGIIVFPVIGGLIVGVMAKYGSDKIRGHGIPEAMESILTDGSKVPPKVAILKPLSAAITIGTGGPFGAEGPIIVTGGAFGSTFAQLLRLTGAERKTLLVAGAGAGMAAVFGTPLAAVAIGIEVLLFEFKPRSLIPVAVACFVAAFLRFFWIGHAPLFPVASTVADIGFGGLGGVILVGVTAGVLSIILTTLLYAFEDGYKGLPIDWMWWPALGALAVGIGGIWFPSAMGVGYSNIRSFLTGADGWHFILAMLLVKTVIWAISLSSGTSGGTLAPIMMIACAMGAAEGHILPDLGPGFWPLIAMGAALGGTLRAPLTGILFALEVTHDMNALLPLVLAVSLSWGITVLALRRSILTEKVAHRGFHISMEYAVDPMEMLLVKEVMRTNVAAFPSTATISELALSMRADHQRNAGQRLYPIVDVSGKMMGVISRSDLQVLVNQSTNGNGAKQVGQMANPSPIVAFADEPLRWAVYRMARTGVTRMPVVERLEPSRLLGMVSLNDMLAARLRDVHEERERERVLRLHVFFGSHRATKREADEQAQVHV